MAPTGPKKSSPRKPAAKKVAAAAKQKASPRAPRKRAAHAPAPRKRAAASPAKDASAAPAKRAPVAPEGLGPVGGKLWRSVVNEYDLRPDELRILEDACREAMLIDRLDSDLVGAPLLAKGSMGQPVASPLVQEIRQHRMTFASLMARLKLEDVDGPDGPGERSARARAAATARWRRG